MSKKTLAPLKSVTVRDRKGLKFMSIVEAAYNKATLSEAEAQRVNDTPGLSEVVASFIADNRIEDKRFIKRKTLRVTVPVDYNPDTALASLDRKKFYYFNAGATDEHYSQVSHQLVPGQTYEVDVYDIRQGEVVSSAHCVRFLESQKSLFTGAQGVAMVWEQQRKELPKGRYYASFDKKEKLWQDADGRRRVPGVSRDSGGGFVFRLGYFEYGWRGVDGLLVFRDPSLAT